MGIALAGCQHTIVTGLTATGHTFVVETIDLPATGVMAVIAGCVGGDMVSMFTGGNLAVMAGFAIAGDTFMIEAADGPVLG